jgi:hypothetical protein
VIDMIDEILFFFSPAIFSIAFITTVIDYLILLCEGGDVTLQNQQIQN